MAQTEKIYETLVTDTGTALVTAATINGEQMQIAALAVGDGGGTYYRPVSSMTTLKNEKWRGDINAAAINEQAPNMIDIAAIIPANVGGWTIREMGIFDANGNMVAVCNTPDTEKVIITSGAAGEIELVMHIEVSSTSVITFTIDPNVITARKKAIEDHNVFEHAHNAQFANKASVDHTHLAEEIGADPQGSAQAVQDNLQTHMSDAVKHVTAEERKAWNEKASISQIHGASDITSGTLPLFRGGTGSTTAAGALSSIGAAAVGHTHTAAQVGADAVGSAAGVQNSLNAHTGNKSNPHGVTAAQVVARPTTDTAKVVWGVAPILPTNWQTQSDGALVAKVWISGVQETMKVDRLH